MEFSNLPNRKGEIMPTTTILTHGVPLKEALILLTSATNSIEWKKKEGGYYLEIEYKVGEFSVTFFSETYSAKTGLAKEQKEANLVWTALK